MIKDENHTQCLASFGWIENFCLFYEKLFLYVVWFHVQNEIQRILMENLMVWCSKVAHFTLHLHLFLENLFLLLLWKMYLKLELICVNINVSNKSIYESSGFVYWLNCIKAICSKNHEFTSFINFFHYFLFNKDWSIDLKSTVCYLFIDDNRIEMKKKKKTKILLKYTARKTVFYVDDE